MTSDKLRSLKNKFFIGVIFFIFSACYAADIKKCESDCEIRQALLGDGEAAYRIGNSYLYKDREKMKYWYRISSENGYVHGQHNYAHFLARDSKSAEDCYRAIFWFKEAAKNGDKVSEKYYQRLERAMNSGQKFEGGCSASY